MAVDLHERAMAAAFAREGAPEAREDARLEEIREESRIADPLLYDDGTIVVRWEKIPALAARHSLEEVRRMLRVRRNSWVYGEVAAGYAHYGAARHIPYLLGEIDRLRALNESLAERVAAQGELLSRRAEKTP